MKCIIFPVTYQTIATRKMKKRLVIFGDTRKFRPVKNTNMTMNPFVNKVLKALDGFDP
jgi:hypothetical protein